MSKFTYDQIIAAYVATRDTADDLAERHKKELAPLKDKLQKLAGWLQARLNDEGQQSTRTDSGTAYIEETRRIKLADRDAFLVFVSGTGEDQLMAEPEPDIPAIKDYIDEHGGHVPPGLEMTITAMLKVRRA